MAWKVNINLNVKNDLFVNKPGSESTVEPLRGIRIYLYASTLNSGGWVSWGSGSTDENGRTRIVKSPIDRSRIGYAKKRRFKIKVRFSSGRAKVLDAGGKIREAILITPKMDGDNVYIDHVFTEVLDGEYNKTMTKEYLDTRSAQFLVGYSKVYDQLKEWDAKPIQTKIVWPDGKGNKDYAGWSPPGGLVRISRSWFWKYEKDNNTWVNPFLNPSSFGRRLNYIRRETTHEAVHQWFYSRIYTPVWIIHNTGNTHDFLEDPALAFFEAVAEFAAIEINKAAFNVTSDLNEEILSRRGMYLRFKGDNERDRKADGSRYFDDARELRPMIECKGRKYESIRVWHKQFFRAEAVAQNYLRMLILKDWYQYDYGDSFKSRSESRMINKPAIVSSTIIQPRQLLTAEQFMHAICRWKEKYTGAIPESERGIEGFFVYLGRKERTYRNNFRKYKSLVLKLGDPHYAGKVNGNDAHSL